MTAVSENGKAQRTEIEWAGRRGMVRQCCGVSRSGVAGPLSIHGRRALSVGTICDPGRRPAHSLHDRDGRLSPFDRTRRTSLLAHGSHRADGYVLCLLHESGFGSIDLGAGGWTSVQHDFSRLRVGGAVLFQGTKTYIPTRSWARTSPLCHGCRRPGHRLRRDVRRSCRSRDRPGTTLNAKALQTRTVAGSDGRARSRMLMASVSHLFGGVTPIDVGYKLATGGGLRAQSFFVQGNFAW